MQKKTEQRQSIQTHIRVHKVIYIVPFKRSYTPTIFSHYVTLQAQLQIHVNCKTAFLGGGGGFAVKIKSWEPVNSLLFRTIDYRLRNECFTLN